MADVRLVVGLGNPGPEYAETRHNLGFKVIEALDGALGIEVKQRKFNARIGEGWHGGKKVILMKPWTFMNRSGQAVATAVGFYKLDLRNLLVVVDDMALETGCCASGPMVRRAGTTAWPTSSRSSEPTRSPGAASGSAPSGRPGGGARAGPARVRGEAAPESGDPAGAGCGAVLARLGRGQDDE